MLNTIPKLFDAYGDVILLVTGSDSKPEFTDKCRINCSKKCGEGPCKNAHRRINIYRGFVDKHFDLLNETYTFQGGEGIDDQNFIEPYKRGKKYNAVLVMRKNA